MPSATPLQEDTWSPSALFHHHIELTRQKLANRPQRPAPQKASLQHPSFKGLDGCFPDVILRHGPHSPILTFLRIIAGIWSLFTLRQSRQADLQ